MRDSLWHWDADWFWCSEALGLQRPWVRRLWPRRYRRSDVYRRLVALDRRYRLSASVARLRGRPEELVVQDVEVPVQRTAEFLDFFHREIGELAEVRHLDYRDLPETGFDAVSSIGLTEDIGLAQLPAYFRFL